MGDHVIIAAPVGHLAEFRRRLVKVWTVRDRATGGFEVIDGDEIAIITQYLDAAREFEPETLARMSSVVREPEFCSIRFRKIRFCREILRVMVADDEKVIVNTNSAWEVILRGREFIRYMDEHPAWDWRREED